MPLDEIALEELGLAPRWVRKGVQGVVAEHAVRGDEVTASVPARTVQTEPTHAQAARPVVTPLPAETRVGQAEAARSEQVERVAQPESPLARPASLSSDEPPPLTEDDFGWFDSVAAPAAPHDTAPSRASGAARSEVATLDWDSLAERVASCTQCRLCEKRTNTVFGVGDREADWMLIGEAPGENEDRLGEPFVGQAGKLLDNMLRALTLSRQSNVYIANVIKCRPPQNRNPEQDEVETCEPFLFQQIDIIKPKVIVALGTFAARALLRTLDPISRLRGRLYEYRGAKLIPTFHPAYLLRNPSSKREVWEDMKLVRSLLHG